MTQPTPSGEPALIGGAIIAVADALLVLVGVFGISLPSGLGGALAGVVGALVIAVPVVVNVVVRSKVTPVAAAPAIVVVPTHLDPPAPLLYPSDPTNPPPTNFV